MNSNIKEIRENWDRIGNSQSKINFISISKILIISFTAIYLVGNFVPFYDGDDASIIGFTSINLSNGQYSITNELLEETGSWDFVPRHWIKTIYNSAIPQTDIGLPIVGTLAYLIAGNYGLFYLVPIITTIFLILADRIATNLFGRMVGLLTLLFLASSFWILQFGIQTMSDIPFAMIFLLGCFFFMKYLNQPLEKYLIISSSIFALSAFFRMIGVVSFLVEILVILSFFIYNIILRNKYNEINENVNKKNNQTTISLNKLFKIIFSIGVPWLLFFLFLFSFNDHYFENPLSMKELVTETMDYKILEQIDDESIEMWYAEIHNQSVADIINQARAQGIIVSKDSSVISFNLENIFGYFRAILPFPLSHDIEFIDNQEDLFGKYWIGFLTPVLLASIFWISYKKNFKRKEIIIFTIFLLSIILLYSSLSTAESQHERNISQRYSIPAFSLFSMMIGFFIYQIFIDSKLILLNNKRFVKIFKTLFLFFLIIFFSLAFYVNPPIQAILNDDFKIKNPKDDAIKYPHDPEGLSKNSIVLDSKGYITTELGLTPLRSLDERFDPEKFENNPFSQGLISKIKKLMNDGYEIYVLKDPSRKIDKLYFQFLVENHDFVLIDYSKSFCKFYLFENLNNTTKSDKICI